MPNKFDIMSKCIEFAKKAAGMTKTNPLVGAAIVKNGKISYGIHERYGGPHAEVNAIENAGENVCGAELFVTLEPCSTYGKTPACIDLIKSSGIKKVYIGVLDPNPSHSGRGVELLKSLGIETESGVMAQECAELIEDFVKAQKFSLPYVTIKAAMSADGKIALENGDSKWITGDESRRYVHKMRGQSDAVLTGIGTVLADNPMLNDRRDTACHQPVRVVLDSLCRLPVTSSLAKTASEIPVISYVSDKADTDKINALKDIGVDIEVAETNELGINIEYVLRSLYGRGFMNVMVEAGNRLNGAFFDGKSADRLELFIAPKIIGGERSVSVIGGSGVPSINSCVSFHSYDINKCGNDIRISAKLKDYSASIVNFTYDFIGKQCLRV